MTSPAKCSEGMVYVSAGAYEGEQFPALCVDKPEFTNGAHRRLSVTASNGVQLRSVDSDGRTVAVLGVEKDAGTLWNKFAKTVPALTGGVAGYVLKFMSSSLPPLRSPAGFDGENQPMVDVSGPEAKLICEVQGKRLATPKEWARIASQNGTKKHSTRSGELDVGVHYNASATRNVCNARGHYVAFVGDEVCDLNGNVCEWTFDPSSGNYNISGGSWLNKSWNGNLRAGSHYVRHPDFQNSLVGFRCVDEAA